VVGIDDIGNRRPNTLVVTERYPESTYVGIEGGLIEVTAAGWSWVFESMDGEGDDYAYVRAVWVDPCDPEHMVFGGDLNGDDPVLQLYETFDGGEQVARIDSPSGVTSSDFRVERGVTLGAEGQDLALLLTLDGETVARSRVLVRRHGR
jgi:hypothetical protein